MVTANEETNSGSVPPIYFLLLAGDQGCAVLVDDANAKPPAPAIEFPLLNTIGEIIVEAILRITRTVAVVREVIGVFGDRAIADWMTIP